MRISQINCRLQQAKKYNIHIVLVPENLTYGLKPLDVKVNRRIQVYYEKIHNEYISKANSDQRLQTKSDTLKLPGYSSVAQWT